MDAEQILEKLPLRQPLLQNDDGGNTASIVPVGPADGSKYQTCLI